MVVVSEAIARRAALPRGVPTTFHTANGALAGRTVTGLSVQAGPLSVSSMRVGVRGGDLGQGDGDPGAAVVRGDFEPGCSAASRAKPNPLRAQVAGLMFWFTRNRFFGSSIMKLT